VVIADWCAIERRDLKMTKGLIIDQWGDPIDRSVLTQEIAAPAMSGVRSPMPGYAADGLTPDRLAMILRDADAGNVLRYLELAETIEERDPHYTGVLGTRKRSVSQLEITVEAASDDVRHQEHADMIRNWLKRDELSGDLFDMLDAIGKGYSFTEIIWDFSQKQYFPQRLELRDPRWFRFERNDLTTPMLISDGGQDMPLPPFKFIRTVIRAKSGLPLRSGIARIACWAWMFKAYTQRDWAIFTQTYGQPIRVGKFGAGATDNDKATLLRAVSNIAGDCAAIIPESMAIEFVEAKNLGTGASNYKDRANWLDQQISKLILGQTATTDAIAGGHAVGREHRLVQEDIERADAKAMSAIINRDLIIPWVMLEYGPQEAYPRLKIGRAEEKDIKSIVDMVTRVVPMGIKVGKKQMRDLIGLGEPDESDELLTPAVFHPKQDMIKADGLTNANDDDSSEDKNTIPASAVTRKGVTPRLPQDVIADAGTAGAEPAVAAMLDKIKAMLNAAETLEEFEAMLQAADLGTGDLELATKQSLLLAELSGRLDV
jgi:phage gp29-like protein